MNISISLTKSRGRPKGRPGNFLFKPKQSMPAIEYLAPNPATYSRYIMQGAFHQANKIYREAQGTAHTRDQYYANYN